MIYSKGSLQFEHFRNAVTQVWCSQGTFHGIGVVITDQAEILVGKILFTQASSTRGTLTAGTSSSPRTATPTAPPCATSWPATAW